ncbi:MAG: DUF445 domain-containing protein [Epsilonproteobacteria bacterium]|nr:DUF445 domain-containing protein [Campylobacterota bacterium]
MNKSFATDLVSILLILISWALPEPYKNMVLYTGLFAFSGAITNQIAIHMLFEKVPFFYGSGVIELRFESFKNSIKNLMMNQFFTKEQIDNFFKKEEKRVDLTPVIQQSDFSPAFDALVKTVMESSFGGMLGMFGGESALATLKEPFCEKLKTAVLEISQSQDFTSKLDNYIKQTGVSDGMLNSIENMIDIRLDELTPQLVKEIVQDFIKEHLGWLVIWGGFFGALIGLASSLVLRYGV